MAEEALFRAIEKEVGSPLTVTRSVSGGDISEARYLETRGGDRLFLKFHHASDSARMFACEAHGLKLISDSRKIRTPAVVCTGSVEGAGYLLLEWIAAERPSDHMWLRLGEQLAGLHSCSNDAFGLEEDNYIGSLAQSNTPSDSWAAFYVGKRIRPQLERAQRAGTLNTAEVSDLEQLTDRLPDILPQITPSLIHGDLWGGNIMFDEHGPILIDPAVAYGHGMMDIAMSQLFGGFSATFYQSYYAASGERPDRDLTDLYQLYYLLVHVNLFGRSYAPSVMRIVRKFV